MFRVERFKGLNESPSGEAGLAWGEAAEARNFRVTREGGLQVRPGSRTLWQFDGPVEGIWEGTAGGNRVRLAAAAEQLWRLGEPGEAESLGRIGPGRCRFFGFDGKVYLLTPKRYMVWTGYGQVTDVAGYRPVVAVAVPPAGGGSLLEQVNKLTGARRAFFSPDGTAKKFQLPNIQVSAVDYAVDRETGAHLAFTADREAGTVTFAQTPRRGVSSLEIGWTCGSGDRGTVVGMSHAELYSGQTDNRVFLYGDGTNRAVYSGVNYDGRPDPTYFPDMNVLEVGAANTPITGVLRHFSKMLIFKPDGAFAVQAGSTELENGSSIPVFYLQPIQREMGCQGLGLVTLVDNDPRSLWAGGVYRWRSSSGYLTLDERVAQRISQRVEATLGEMALEEAAAFDDQARREWYLTDGTVTLVHNYDVDGWYRYEGLPIHCMGVLGEALYFGTKDGRLCRLSRDYRNDDGRAIDALWRSGAMDFGRMETGKYQRWLWLTMKPESGAAVTVTTRSDKRSSYPVTTVRASLMSYRNASFRHWSYAVNRQPKVSRVRLRVKKARYQQLMLSSYSTGETATVLGLEGRVRESDSIKR